MIPCTLALIGLAQFGSRPPLDPRDYASPSGECVLHVEPSSRDGAGPGQYRLRRGEDEVWAAELPFTLFDARVTDSGSTVGYAYDGGVDVARGSFREIALSPQGAMLLDAKTERFWCRHVVCPPPAEPRALGLVVDEEHDRFAVRIADDDYNRGMELWRVYRISKGEKLAEFRPGESLFPATDTRVALWDARALPGTDLFLLHWGLVDFRDGAEGFYPQGALFSLIELGGRTVWKLELERDYTVEGEEEATGALVERMRENGAIRGTSSPGSFDILFAKEQQRVSLCAIRDPVAPTGWTVKEVRRTRFELTQPSKSELATVPEIALESLGTVVLQRPTKVASPIRDIWAWDFAEGGGFELIRRGESWGEFSFAGIDAQGRLARETVLESLPAEPRGEFHWAPLDGDQWIATWSPLGVEQKSLAFRVHTRSGDLRPLEGFECPSVNAIASLGDGFVVLGTFQHEYTSEEGVFCFNSSGALRWTLEQDDDSDDPAKLFSPEALTVTTDGHVVVLDVIRHTLQVFTGNGQYVRTVDLEQTWNQEPNYPSGLTAGPHGTVLVHDFDSDPPLWHMTLDGKVIDRFSPRFPDGRRVDARHTRFAPDGSLWATDGFSFLELDRHGVVRRIHGESAQQADIYERGAFGIEKGRICIQDERTGNLHVWNCDGTKLFTGLLDPEQAHELTRIGRIVVDPAGMAYVEREGFSGNRYFQWGPSGDYRGVVDLGGNAVFDPGTGNRWVWGFRTGLTGLDTHGQELIKVEHKPDGTWIRAVEDADVGPDGTVVALDPPDLLFISREGRPVRRLEVPESAEDPLNALELSSVAFSGRWIALYNWAPRAALVREEDGAVFVFAPDLPRPERSSWKTGFSPDGRELWMLEAPALVLHRFALP